MQFEVGSVLEGKVTGITNFGAFVELPGGKTGMVHISEVARTYVKEIRDHVTDNQVVKVKVLSIGDDGKISLSIKAAQQPDGQKKRTESNSFEEMLLKFKQSSEEKMSDLRKIMDSKRGGSQRRSGR